MKEREPIIIGGLVILMLILWLGFMVHSSPRFAGSAWGGALAVSGTLLMLVPLAYLIIKRVKPLKKWVTRYVSMRRLLAWHIYAGVLGPILVILHTAHKFESPLGIALTAMTLIVVVSGFVGRYLMTRFGREIKQKQAMLDELNDAYRTTLKQLQDSDASKAQSLRPFAGILSRVVGGWLMTRQSLITAPIPLDMRALRLSESIADLEYAIRTHETFKAAFKLWLKLHIALSCVLYILLSLHIWAAIHFGLRWLA